MGCHSILQGTFPIQRSNLDLLHRRWILYHLSHHEQGDSILVGLGAEILACRCILVGCPAVKLCLFVIPGTAARQTLLSFTISWSLLKLMSIESVMPSNHLIPCRPFFLLPSTFPSIRVFSNESALHASEQYVNILSTEQHV